MGENNFFHQLTTCELSIQPKRSVVQFIYMDTDLFQTSVELRSFKLFHLNKHKQLSSNTDWGIMRLFSLTEKQLTTSLKQKFSGIYDRKHPLYPIVFSYVEAVLFQTFTKINKVNLTLRCYRDCQKSLNTQMYITFPPLKYFDCDKSE